VVHTQTTHTVCDSDDHGEKNLLRWFILFVLFKFENKYETRVCVHSI